MALLIVEHGGKEFFDEDEVGDEIDLEDLVQSGLLGFEDGLAGTYTAGSD